MTSHTNHRRTAILPRLLAVAVALTASLVLSPQGPAQDQSRGRGRSEQQRNPEQRRKQRCERPLGRRVTRMTARLQTTP